ncbi:dUTP diphosphatase [Corynebacterium diphtheriae]|nr:dUTP diphosphatase [Corynebacterium diphtheriae]CAB1035326.1 dUTP diphosphatase [Corynebacterium diphtheriae]
MDIFVKRLSQTATNPTRAHVDDAGLDLYLDKAVTVPVGGTAVATTGIAVLTPKGRVGQVNIRSGIAFNRGITLGNGTGVIDAGYTGEIKLLLHNISKSPQSFPAGTRLAQITFIKIETPEPMAVAEFPQTQRGANGFGSTGV